MRTLVSLALSALIAALSVCSSPARAVAVENGRAPGTSWIVAQLEYPDSRQRELEEPSYRQQQLEGVQEPPPPRYEQPAYNSNEEVYEENLQRRGITTQRLRGTRYYR
jgi:hypothetical protein